MDVRLLFYTPLEIAIKAARTSHDSVKNIDTVGNDLGEKDKKMIEFLIASGHHSVFEHIVYTFEISNISRAVLQELARHRHISMTVQSSRYTLKKDLRNKQISNMFVIPDEQRDFFVKVLNVFYVFLEQGRELGIQNDYLKYIIPEAFKTKLVLTVNARELSHIIQLRIANNALWEFQELAKMLLEEVMKVHKVLWEIWQKYWN